MKPISNLLDELPMNAGLKAMATPMKAQASYDSESQEIKTLYPTETGWLSRIPEEYRAVSLESCTILPPLLIEFGKKWASSWPLKSLFLTGEFGSGKTTFAFAVIREVMRNVNPKNYFWPRYFTGRQLDSRLLKASRHEEGDEYDLDDLGSMDLLFIDDLDKVIGTDRFKVQIFEVINRRLEKRKPTIITSNFFPDELVSLLGGAVISRIGDESKWQTVQFPPKDLRKTKKKVVSFYASAEM